MQTLLLPAAVCIVLYYLYAAMESALGSRTFANLEVIPPFPSGGTPPKVSILVAACKERGGIEHALTSVVHRDYPDFEVIVVNDRSTDCAGEILNCTQQTKPKLQIIAIHQLPPAGTGKKMDPSVPPPESSRRLRD